MKTIKERSDIIRIVVGKRYHYLQHPLMHQLEGIMVWKQPSGLLVLFWGLIMARHWEDTSFLFLNLSLLKWKMIELHKVISLGSYRYNILCQSFGNLFNYLFLNCII